MAAKGHQRELIYDAYGCRIFNVEPTSPTRRFTPGQNVYDSATPENRGIQHTYLPERKLRLHPTFYGTGQYVPPGGHPVDREGRPRIALTTAGMDHFTGARGDLGTGHSAFLPDIPPEPVGGHRVHYVSAHQKDMQWARDDGERTANIRAHEDGPTWDDQWALRRRPDSTKTPEKLEPLTPARARGEQNLQRAAAWRGDAYPQRAVYPSWKTKIEDPSFQRTARIKHGRHEVRNDALHPTIHPPDNFDSKHASLNPHDPYADCLWGDPDVKIIATPTLDREKRLHIGASHANRLEGGKLSDHLVDQAEHRIGQFANIKMTEKIHTGVKHHEDGRAVEQEK